MPRISQVVGQLKIRQVYSRRGENYCAISMPPAIMRLLGWGPGDMLQYFPTTDGGMKIIPLNQVMNNIAEYDEEAARIKPRELRGPRPDSLAERELEIERQTEGLIRQLSESQRPLNRKTETKGRSKPRRR
jgi:hypothetical protein